MDSQAVVAPQAADRLDGYRAAFGACRGSGVMENGEPAAAPTVVTPIRLWALNLGPEIVRALRVSYRVRPTSLCADLCDPRVERDDAARIGGQRIPGWAAYPRSGSLGHQPLGSSSQILRVRCNTSEFAPSDTPA
jgi:hypothetical protein